MSDPFASAGFDLDLTDNTVSEGLPVLRAGIYDAHSIDAELKSGKGSNKTLSVVFQDKDGTGQNTFNFNIVHTSSEAQRIGRDQLKTFLTHGGHPDPDHPFKHGVESFKKLPVRIFVEHDGTYVKNNQTRDSYAIKRFAKVDPANPASGRAPEAARGSTSGSVGSAGTASLDDAIPF